MAKKVSCALIGPGVGPLVRVAGVGRVRVRGLLAGESVRVQLHLDGTKVMEELESNGEHRFEKVDFLRVAYEGVSKSLIALVVIGDS